MASYSMNQLRNGLKVLLDDQPHNIVDTEFVKPGKGQAFVRLKTKNLLDGSVHVNTYKSSDTVPGADVLETEMQYLYTDGETWHFMDPQTYEQHAVSKDGVGDASDWLKEQDSVYVTLWNGLPISVTPPNHVILKIVRTDPGFRGDTSSGGTKPATLETGAVVKVPLFLQEGESIKVDTRTGEYLSRAKE
jgi:elongation factor P